MKLEQHLFICTYQRDQGESCGAKGSSKLRDQLKTAVSKQHPEWKGRVRINASGCLGRCEQGIAAVLYPEATWWTELKSDDDSRETLLKALESRMGNSV